MAKTKEQRLEEQKLAEQKLAEESQVEESQVEEPAPSPAPKTGPSYDELLSLVQQLAGEINTLKAAQNSTSAPVVSTQAPDKTDRILELLANRKSDREVFIIHNCEMLEGLSTHLELTGLVIDFHALGEQRLLSWQQFEECVSKYRTFFEKEIILLADDEGELAARYSIPCVKRTDKHTLTREDILKLPTLEVRALEDFIKTLTDADKDFIYSYWLGKCYNREQGYYDRYKIEMLNNLSGRKVFDNLLALMNGDFRNE